MEYFSALQQFLIKRFSPAPRTSSILLNEYKKCKIVVCCSLILFSHNCSAAERNHSIHRTYINSALCTQILFSQFSHVTVFVVLLKSKLPSNLRLQEKNPLIGLLSL